MSFPALVSPITQLSFLHDAYFDNPVISTVHVKGLDGRVELQEVEMFGGALCVGQGFTDPVVAIVAAKNCFHVQLIDRIVIVDFTATSLHWRYPQIKLRFIDKVETLGPIFAIVGRLADLRL